MIILTADYILPPHILGGVIILTADYILPPHLGGMIILTAAYILPPHLGWTQHISSEQFEKLLQMTHNALTYHCTRDKIELKLAPYSGPQCHEDRGNESMMQYNGKSYHSNSRNYGMVDKPSTSTAASLTAKYKPQKRNKSESQIRHVGSDWLVGLFDKDYRACSECNERLLKMEAEESHDIESMVHYLDNNRALKSYISTVNHCYKWHTEHSSDKWLEMRHKCRLRICHACKKERHIRSSDNPKFPAVLPNDEIKAFRLKFRCDMLCTNYTIKISDWTFNEANITCQTEQDMPDGYGNIRSYILSPTLEKDLKEHNERPWMLEDTFNKETRMQRYNYHRNQYRRYLRGEIGDCSDMACGCKRPKGRWLCEEKTDIEKDENIEIVTSVVNSIVKEACITIYPMPMLRINRLTNGELKKWTGHFFYEYYCKYGQSLFSQKAWQAFKQFSTKHKSIYQI